MALNIWSFSLLSWLLPGTSWNTGIYHRSASLRKGARHDYLEKIFVWAISYVLLGFIEEGWKIGLNNLEFLLWNSMLFECIILKQNLLQVQSPIWLKTLLLLFLIIFQHWVMAWRLPWYFYEWLWCRLRRQLY